MAQQPEDLDPELHVNDPNADPNAEELPPEEAESGDAGRIVPAWLISFAIHATIAFIFSWVVFSQAQKDDELPPMRISIIDPPPEKKEEKKLERDLETKPEIKIDLVSDVVAPITPVTVDTKIEKEETEEPPRGREEAVSTSEAGGSGAFMAIGAGGGSAGMFGSRSGNGKRMALSKGGGSKGSESAVDAALRWFKKHQSPNGMWDTVNYYKNCTEEGKCEPGTAEGKSDDNIGITGYALLCYLGAGYDHKTPNKYRTTVEAGIRWLKEQQQANGLLGIRNYEHPIAVMALAEAYAMTQDPDLREPAQKGVNYLLVKQNSEGDGSGRIGLGWDYIEPTGRNDASVTGWCVMALKSALAAGLNVGDGMNGARNWLKRSYEIANPNHEQLDIYTGEAFFWYAWKDTAPTADKISNAKPDRVPIGALCAVFLGHHAGDKMLETLLNYVMKNNVPTAYPCNTYNMYYNTLSVFQAGGERWQKWNSTVRDIIIKAQRRDACFDGSWDWKDTVFHEHQIGRTLSTAYCCLSLEVYYRYKQIGNDKQ